jgi:hypothetical protein
MEYATSSVRVQYTTDSVGVSRRHFLTKMGEVFHFAKKPAKKAHSFANFRLKFFSRWLKFGG